MVGMKKILGIAMAFAMAGLALRAGVIKDPISALGLLISVFAWLFVAFSSRLIEPDCGNDDEDLRSHTFIMGRTADGMRGPD